MHRYSLRWTSALVVFLASATSATCQELVVSPNIAQYLRRLNVNIRSGRLEVTTQYLGRNLSATGPRTTDERLTIFGLNGKPAIQYTNRSDKGQVSFEVQDLQQVRIERIAGEKSKAIDLLFTQRPGEDLELRLGKGETAQVYRASNLWLLLLAYPEVCERELLPLLQVLRSGWPLMATSHQVRTSLMDWARRDRRFDGVHFQLLVKQLGSSKYAQRRSAERQLLAQGTQIIPFLMTQDTRRLDAEQRARIRAILASLDNGRRDDPDHIAIHLTTLPGTWLALLHSAGEEERRLAKDQLSSLLGHPIDFDPAADAAARDGQITALERQLPQRPAASTDKN